MMVYVKSLLVGLCAAAAVLCVCWSVRVVKHAAYTPPPSSHPSPVAPSDDDFTVQTSEDILAVTITATRPPWYVCALAGVALVTASGWQLRHVGRSRGRPQHEPELKA